MKTPQLWQKLTAGFKKPFQKALKETPKEVIPEGTGGWGISSHYDSPTKHKRRKIRKRQENKSRAINAKINKNWKK